MNKRRSVVVAHATLLEWIENNPDVSEEDVDEAVIDAALAMASNANNEGFRGQIKFLLIIAGWSEEDIKEYFLDQQ